MSEKRSEFVLQHADGTYHAIGKGHSGSFGMETIKRVDSVEQAERYDGYQFAVNAKNNEPHLRDLPMNIIELRYEVIDRGFVPITVRDWGCLNEERDSEEFARMQSESSKRQGRLAQEARSR